MTIIQSENSSGKRAGLKKKFDAALQKVLAIRIATKSVRPGMFWAFCFLAVFIVLLAGSWRKWPDVVVDYGMQLYLPWQLSSGKVLCRDLAYLTGGPLSQYFHALMFKLLGVSFSTLIFTNLVVLALFVCLLFRLFCRAADQWTAAVICLVTLCVFSFSQYLNIGNYNFLCPYSYEAFHGLVLSIAALSCLWRWIVTRRGSWAFIAGMCSGGVFLTKPDLFLAVTAVLFVGGWIVWTAQSDSPVSIGREYALAFLGLIVPVAAFIAYFALVWNFVDGLKAVAGSWLPLLNSPIAHNPYYQWCLGMDKPGANAMMITQRFASFIVVIMAFVMISRFFRRSNVLLKAALALCLFAFLYGPTGRLIEWRRCGPVLAPVAFFGCIFVASKWWKTRHLPEGSTLVFPVLWSVFSVFLLAKMGLSPRIWHYGFYLGMPAAVFVIFLLVKLLPTELERFEVNPLLFRSLTTVLIVAGSLQLLKVSNDLYEKKSVVVGSDGDQIITDDSRRGPQGYAFRETVSWIQKNTSASNTVAVFPEGVMVNYLTRRTNPTPYLLFTLSEIQAYGETNMLNAYVQNSPDYIVLIHRTTGEWKVNYFGLEPGYGYDIMQWVHANYTPVWLCGHEPLKTDDFGIEILRRRNRSSDLAGLQ